MSGSLDKRGLRSATAAAMALAAERVRRAGLVEGHAASALRCWNTLAADEVRVFADSHVVLGSHSIAAEDRVPCRPVPATTWASL